MLVDMYQSGSIIFSGSGTMKAIVEMPFMMKGKVPGQYPDMPVVTFTKGRLPKLL